ncbi:MAG: M1 family aminopeptidase [Ignavibacteriales bacterium]|nr:M1 family aminopeptidase [Ignavibacteriales bacterium]
MQSLFTSNYKLKKYHCITVIFDVLIFLLLIVHVNVEAQASFNSLEHEQIVNSIFYGANLAFQKRSFMLTETAASTWFDVTYYRLALNIFTQSNSLKGKVTIKGICRDSASILTLDLVNRMQVDSVLVDGHTTSVAHNDNSFDISLARTFTSGEVLSVDVFYEGAPLATGFGSFMFDSHSGVPWVYSLSEPYGAKDWWPCKDDPSDKADSADIIVTCDSTLKVGSEGTLVSVVNNGNGTSTHHWKERYPIASYLISVAITNYTQFSNWFRYSATDSMEILNYVLPEHDSTARQNLPHVVHMLEIYSNLFGLYPFNKEKYGHSEISGGSSMEHQTMTSLTSFNEDVLSHELAHQWFGDMITCQTWSDLWLNEGFAQYSSALYRERQYGVTSYWTYMNSQLDQAKLAHGAIGIPDTSSVLNLFNPQRIYSKGATVLHMLRHVLGDSIFFLSVYTYANDPKLKYSSATMKDFQTVCETVAGKSLAFFFQEWLYGDRFPDYSYAWTWNSLGDSSFILLTINQTTIGTTPSFYTMPIDIRISANGHDTTIIVFNNAQQQNFTIPYPVKPSVVFLDPEGWILKFLFSENDRPPSIYLLEQNYPNPFNSTTTIVYQIPRQEQVVLKIYDILGREVTTLVDAKQYSGVYEYQWNPHIMASGIYFYRLNTGSVQIQRKMVLLK